MTGPPFQWYHMPAWRRTGMATKLEWHDTHSCCYFLAISLINSWPAWKWKCRKLTHHKQEIFSGYLGMSSENKKALSLVINSFFTCRPVKDVAPEEGHNLRQFLQDCRLSFVCLLCVTCVSCVRQPIFFLFFFVLCTRSQLVHNTLTYITLQRTHTQRVESIPTA